MSINTMPYTTVEQVLRLRQEALRLQERYNQSEALVRRMHKEVASLCSDAYPSTLGISIMEAMSRVIDDRGVEDLKKRDMRVKAEALEEFTELMKSYAENAYANGYSMTGDAVRDMCDLAITKVTYIHRDLEEE